MSVTIHRNHYTTNAEHCQLFLMRFRKLFFNWRRTADLHHKLPCGYAFYGQRTCVLHLADGYAQPPTFRGISQWKKYNKSPMANQEYHKNSQMSSDFHKYFFRQRKKRAHPKVRPFRWLGKWASSRGLRELYPQYSTPPQVLSSKIAKNSTKISRSFRFGLQFGLHTPTFSVYDTALAYANA